MQNNASGAGLALEEIVTELSPETDKQQILAADDRIITITKDVDGNVASITHVSSIVGKTLTRTFVYTGSTVITITEAVS